MNKELLSIESQIAEQQGIRDDALRVVAEADRKLLELNLERNRILGTIASRHLYAVPDIMGRDITPRQPDGAA